MSERDRRVREPDHGIPVLNWYDGIFEAVYIALHPFVKIEGLNPADAPRQVLVVNRATIPDETLTFDLVKKISQERRRQFAISLAQVQNLEKKSGKLVRWETVGRGCGFDSIGQTDIALLTIIGAVNEEHGCPSDAQHLEEYCSANKIFLPTEDNIPPVLEQRVCLLLNRLGCESVVVADEYDRKTVTKKRLGLEIETSWFHSKVIDFRFNRLYPADHSFLLVVPWDNFYTMICGDRKALEAAKVEELFEGFWCDKNTMPNWWRR